MRKFNTVMQNIRQIVLSKVRKQTKAEPQSSGTPFLVFLKSVYQHIRLNHTWD